MSNAPMSMNNRRPLGYQDSQAPSSGAPYTAVPRAPKTRKAISLTSRVLQSLHCILIDTTPPR